MVKICKCGDVYVIYDTNMLQCIISITARPLLVVLNAQIVIYISVR